MRTSMNIQKITVLGMLTALAYIFMLVTKLQIMLVPSIPFLQYDPKDIIIVMAGFIYGPLSALIVAVAVAFIEFITVSETQIIGFLMNVIATSAFCCTASFIYYKKRTFSSAILGLVSGVLVLTGVMVIWNVILTPIFMGISREAVIKMLVPGFIPYNLLKGSLNAAFIMLLYKPFVNGLRRTGLIKSDDQSDRGIGKRVAVIGLIVLILCLVIVWMLNSIL